MFSVNKLLGEPADREQAIVIGLVNNMPDAAVRSTERQFHDLLAAASPDRPISMRFFSLPEVPRGAAARAHLNQHYESHGELWTSRLDGLIVTGTEPRAASLEDEPYWAALTKLIDWAEEHTISTVWSCLAAHAAVLHMDGIHRQRLPKKLFGVFNCIKSGEDRIIADVPSTGWSVPHSRYNSLPEGQLIERGYEILARSAETGADLFIKHAGSEFVFFQGHPEYEPDTLLREYRRDAARFLAGETPNYPEMPTGYFDADAVFALGEFRERVLSNRGSDLIAHFPTAAAESRLRHGWRELAVRIYSNWIEYLARRKYRGYNNHTGAALHPANK